MMQTFEAVFKNGALMPTTPINGVSEGQRLRVTVRSEPKQFPLEGLSEEEREQRFLEWLEQEGIIEPHVWSHDPPPDDDFEPIHIKGPPLSQTILEDRD